MDKLTDYIILNNATLKDAYEKMNENEYQIVFVVDKDNKLLFAITDGDIRRHVLAKGTLEESVMVLSKSCVTATSIYDAKKLCKEYKVVPIVNENNTIDILVFRDHILPKRTIDIPVVIQAGGLGTRLYPYTKILPKPLIPIGDMPIIEKIIKRFCEFGCTKFYIIVNHKKEMIKAYFSEGKKYNIEFVDELQPLGTGGGLALLKGKLNQPFIFANCDTFLDCDFADLYDQHLNSNSDVTIISSQIKFQLPYGTLKIDENKKLEQFVEKPTFYFLSNVGYYVVNPNVVDMIPNNTKIHFTTICEQLIDDKKVGVYEIREEEWHDMGEIDKLNKMLEE